MVRAVTEPYRPEDIQVGDRCESLLSVAVQLWVMSASSKSEAESYFDISLTYSERRILSSYFDLFKIEEDRHIDFDTFGSEILDEYDKGEHLDI